ncbi:MAG: alpha/beta hydrolase [Caulobacterales bacterium]|nr:alpha/beta hydrolase [Caulobacterales bacterium]
MPSRTVATPHGQLAVYETGDGPALVLLHADSGRASQWSDLAGRLGRDHRVVSFDFRGSGASSAAANGDYSYAGRAEDIDAVVEALKLDHLVVVAHSGGGPAALSYAASHPGRVAGVFLLDPPSDPRQMPPEVKKTFLSDLAGPGSLAAQKAFYGGIAGGNAAVRERVLRDTECTQAAARYGLGEAMAGWNPEPALDAWSGPLFILASQPSDTPAALYRLRPQIEHRVVENTGHWIHLEQPDEVERAIRDFAAPLQPRCAPSAAG